MPGTHNIDEVYAELDRLRAQVRESAQAIRGEVVHTSAVSRVWATGVALAVLLGFAITLGVWKRGIDDAVEVRIPRLEQTSAEHDRRLRELERHHRQGLREGPGPSEGLATGAY